MKIYVAGPYTASSPLEVQANVDRAIDAGIAIIAKGHLPYIPHLTHYIELRNAAFAREHGIRLTYEHYMTMDDSWLATCDALLYLAPSPGADREKVYAKRRGMPIYSNLKEIPLVKDGKMVGLRSIWRSWTCASCGKNFPTGTSAYPGHERHDLICEPCKEKTKGRKVVIAGPVNTHLHTNLGCLECSYMLSSVAGGAPFCTNEQCDQFMYEQEGVRS